MNKIKNVKLFLFDMDGTLYLDDNLFDFTIELLEVKLPVVSHYDAVCFVCVLGDGKAASSELFLKGFGSANVKSPAFVVFVEVEECSVCGSNEVVLG